MMFRFSQRVVVLNEENEKKDVQNEIQVTIRIHYLKRISKIIKKLLLNYFLYRKGYRICT